MKDITLSEKFIKREIICLLVCFILAFGSNVAAIIIYKTKWEELYTQLFWVVTLALFFYLISVVIRSVLYGIKYLIKKK